MKTRKNFSELPIAIAMSLSSYGDGIFDFANQARLEVHVSLRWKSIRSILSRAVADLACLGRLWHVSLLVLCLASMTRFTVRSWMMIDSTNEGVKVKGRR